MTPLFPARRSAERVRLPRRGSPARRRHVRSADLLELVGALRALPEAQARPEFVADLRERLMVAAQSELVAPGPGQP